MKWLAVLPLFIGSLFLSLSASAAPLPSITVTWTSSGDDGLTGTAAQYDLRWSYAAPDTTNATALNAWWAAATTVSGLPAPLVSGTAQQVTVSPAGGFTEGSTVHFAIRVRDEASNWSGTSNIAHRLIPAPDTTPPAGINSLRAQ